MPNQEKGGPIRDGLPRNKRRPPRYSLKELIRLPMLQELTDELYRATGIQSSVVSTTGELLTWAGWQSICRNYHRKHPKTERECIESDVQVGRKLAEGGPFITYRCPRGLMNAAAPIFIEGEHVATVYAGQLFTEPPNEEREAFFRQQAREFGFDEAGYLDAYRIVPVVTEERFRSALAFLAKFAQMIADMAIARQKEIEALQKLRRNEEQSRRLLESIRTVPWELDLTTKRFTYIGPQAEKLFGYPLSRWRDVESWAGFIHDDDRQDALNLIYRTSMEGHDHDFEYRMVTRDGREIWVHNTVTVIAGPEGPEKLAGYLRDITALKKAEEALHDAGQLNEQIVGGIEEGVIVYGPDLRYRLWNHFMAKLTGRTAEEVLGKHPLTVFPFLKEVGYIDRLEKVLAGEASSESEFPFTNPFTGERNWVLDMIVPMRNVKGQIIGAIATVHDITERKRIEQQLLESEERFRLSFYTSPDSLNINRLDDGLFVDINEGFTRVTGYTREDVLGKTSQEVNLWVNAEDRLKLVRRLLEKGYYENLEAEFLLKDGTVGIGLMSARIIHLRGVPHILSVTRDIRKLRQLEKERKLLEERLQRSEKMEALGTLAGGVAHDLNNVLGVVVGYGEMLVDEIKAPAPAKAHAKKVLEGGMRAAAIVQDLLTMARRGVQARSVLNLNTVIEECRKTPEFERALSPNPRIKLRVDLDPELLNMSGSPVHLSISLINLVLNAVEAMPNGGLLTIATGNQYLDRPLQGYDQIREGDYITLSVSDTGEGISSQDIKRIFEPFYTKKVMGRSGTGLGLAVVWGTVKDHEGYINVQSEEGKGSTFTLYFPVTRETISSEPQVTAPAAYQGRGETILVVDDSEEQRGLALSILEKLNYRATAVSGGEEALAWLKDHRADMIILDMIMEPGMDGLETYRKIAAILPGQRALIVSGFSESERVIQAQSLGAGTYVKKPFTMERLGLAIRRELDRPAA
ncbi:MAG: PAS domain S-box protein [Deltaproteobacteria bacterium]|nr:PAS domain S-box protein [Deltaproteobacteria bacterium]